MLPLRFFANELGPTERVESIIGSTVTSEELLVWRALHRFRLVEFDMAIVDGISSLALVPHRVGVAHIDCSAVAHEALHRLVRHFSLVEASEGGHFDFRLVLRVTAQAKRCRGRMPNVPEIVTGLLRLHVDARGVLVLGKVQLLIKPTRIHSKKVS